jgi:hypothetical protein
MNGVHLELIYYYINRTIENIYKGTRRATDVPLVDHECPVSGPRMSRLCCHDDERTGAGAPDPRTADPPT